MPIPFSVRHLVLDEADRLLDQEFISQTREIIAACTHDLLRKTVFSATLPAGVEKIAMEILRNPVRVVVGLKYATLFTCRRRLSFYCPEIPLSRQFPKALPMLPTSRPNCLLYCNTYQERIRRQSLYLRLRNPAHRHWPNNSSLTTFRMLTVFMLECHGKNEMTL